MMQRTNFGKVIIKCVWQPVMQKFKHNQWQSANSRYQLTLINQVVYVRDECECEM